MTKVIISPDLLSYRNAMANTVEQVRRETTVAGVGLCSYEQAGSDYGPDVVASDPRTAGLLEPPRIEMLWPEIKVHDGQIDGLVQVRASGDFGVMNVYVIVRDDQGNLIESDFAMRNPVYMTHWMYFFEADAGALHSVTVQAIVMDCLGGVDVKTESAALQ